MLVSGPGGRTGLHTNVQQELASAESARESSSPPLPKESASPETSLMG